MEGNLIHRVDPQYPVIAKQIHLEGAVVLNAIISRDGNIERVDVASGPGCWPLRQGKRSSNGSTGPIF